MKYISLLLLISLLNTCTPATDNKTKTAPAPDLPDDWVEIDTEQWYIAFPYEWAADTSGQYGTQLILAAPAESEDDQFYETINIASAKVGEQIQTIEAFTEANIEMFKKGLENWELEVSEAVDLNGRSAHHLTYTGKQGVFNSRWDQYFMLDNGFAWVLTFSSEQRRWDEISPVAAQILRTFELRNG